MNKFKRFLYRFFNRFSREKKWIDGVPEEMRKKTEIEELNEKYPLNSQISAYRRVKSLLVPMYGLEGFPNFRKSMLEIKNGLENNNLTHLYDCIFHTYKSELTGRE